MFVVSGWLGKPHRSAPSVRVVSADELRALHGAGIEIGAHSVTHPDLSTLTYEEAKSELEQSKRDLERELDAPVEVAAYPYGRASAEPCAPPATQASGRPALRWASAPGTRRTTFPART